MLQASAMLGTTTREIRRRISSRSSDEEKSSPASASRRKRASARFWPVISMITPPMPVVSPSAPRTG
jgi:hypothetical protein